MCSLSYADFVSCEVCKGITRNCPRQNSSHCIVPKALDMAFPSGVMVIKVNATSEIGSVTSDNFTEPDINFRGKVLHSWLLDV